MSHARPLKIHSRLLLAIYACIPLAMLVILFDRVWFSSSLRSVIPADDPQKLALFTLLFTLPHILSSFFGFIDKTYVKYYDKKLLRGAQYTVIGALLLPIVSVNLAFLVFALLTMYHVFRQQSGIAKSLMRGMNRWHIYWEWLGILLSFALYLDIYTNLHVPKVFVYVWVAGLLPYTFLALRAARGSTTKIGTVYFWATHIIPIMSGIFLLLDYPLLSIAVPRIIHDLTGYVFYITHDYNRYLEAKANYLYRLFAPTHLPVTFLNPFISVGLAFLFRQNNQADIYILLTILFLFHYYNESYMWKKDSLHRKYIAFVP